jgi:hypothetical protein
VSVAMKKMPDVDSVEVRLNKGDALIKFKPGNKVRFDQVVGIVRDKAFTPKEARVAARGQIVQANSKLQLKVTGIDEIYDLEGAAVDLKRHAGKTVVLDGVIPAPQSKTYKRVIQVKAIKPVT